jgi:tRNA 2-thiocytidine biosynthesis protein TtcA
MSALPRYSYSYKTLNSLVGKAIHRYDMIGNGDRIAVGVSGGKDSLMLLWALAERRKRVPVHYDLYPIYVDPGFEGGFGEALADTCQQFGFSPHRRPYRPRHCRTQCRQQGEPLFSLFAASA